jgi:hypothetical protein
MKVPSLSQRSNAFDERNTFVHALLGMRIYGQRFNDYVEELCAPRSVRKARTPSTAPEPEVLLVLGLFALWRRVEGALDNWEVVRRSVQRPRPPASKRRLTRLNELFR